MRIKRLIPTIGIVSIILCGCGQTQNTTISETTTEQATEITTTQEETTTEATTEITTEQVSEGVRENPCAVGYKEDIKFWGYSIESYGYATVGITDYSDGQITFYCKLNSYGYSNSLKFNVGFDLDYYENNNMVYLYPCDDPKTFSVSKYDEYEPVEDVEVPCGEEKAIKFNIDESKRYVAVVYYTMRDDGLDYTDGRYDFIDNNDLYGHIIFYNLDK